MIFLMAIEDPIRRSQLEEIYKLYQKDMYLTAYDLVKDHDVAEDIIHDAILKANDNLEKISDVKCKKTRSYLVIIVKNLCYDHFKKDKVKGVNMKHTTPVEDLINIQDTEELIETGFLHRETILEISELMDLLKPSYSEVLKLYYYDELSLTEISEILGITTNNVGVRINRAIKAIQKLNKERSECRA
ncbi:MAG: hypothetical protein CVV02_16260 [Firmicutes bacterium HGW-Firmicutes-7]|nr:MAG: hypothetical protein CVV02_16260 [Firmicutes bacterium HGW-Firmicutes-7]